MRVPEFKFTAVDGPTVLAHDGEVGTEFDGRQLQRAIPSSSRVSSAAVTRSPRRHQQQADDEIRVAQSPSGQYVGRMVHVEHDPADPDRDDDHRAAARSSHRRSGGARRARRSSATRARRPSRRARDRTETPSPARPTNAVAGRGRSADVLGELRRASPDSSTVISRNSATRTLRRHSATTITTTPANRKAAGPSTVQNTSHAVTQPGCVDSVAVGDVQRRRVHGGQPLPLLHIADPQQRVDRHAPPRRTRPAASASCVCHVDSSTSR